MRALKLMALSGITGCSVGIAPEFNEGDVGLFTTDASATQTGAEPDNSGDDGTDVASSAGGSDSTAATDEGSTGATGSTDGITGPCPVGRADCDDRPGCEADLDGPATCGSCVKSCKLDSTTLSCNAGKCEGTLIWNVEDTFVDEGDPMTAFGKSDQLSVSASPNLQHVIVKPIDLGGVPLSSDIKVLAGTLTVTAARAGVGIVVHRTKGTWPEDATSWDNRPEFSANVLAEFDPVLGPNTINITHRVQGWIDGQVPGGVTLLASDTAGALFRSGEYKVAADRPYFEVEVSY